MKTNKLIKLGNIYKGKGQAGFVFSIKGLAPTLVTFTNGGGKEPLIFAKARK